MELIEIFKGLLTPLVAVIAVYIAWQQLKTNQRKLKFDLFEKRIAVYRDFVEFSSSASSPNVAQNEPLLVSEQFQKIMAATKFIFHEEMRDELSNLHNKAIDYQILIEKKTDEDDSERQSEIKLELKAKRKSMINLSNDIEKKFKKYLDFSKIK